MNEAGSILINLDAASQQHLIKAPRHTENQLLIRDAGHNDPHVYTTLSSGNHCIHQVIAKHKIRCKKPCVIRALRKQVNKELITGSFMVKGRIVVTKHITIKCVRRRRIPFGICGHCKLSCFFFQRKCVPKGQEHMGKIFYWLTSNPKACVLPVSIGMFQIDIPI